MWFAEKTRLNSLFTHGRQKAHSGSMMTLSTLGFPLVHASSGTRPRQNSPYVETSKLNSGIDGTRYGEASVEWGDDPRLRSDCGADSVPYYGNRRFSVSKGLGRRNVDSEKGQERGEREYWRCAAFKYCIQVTFRTVSSSFPLRSLRALFSTLGIPRDRTSHNYRKVSKETKEEAV